MGSSIPPESAHCQVILKSGIYKGTPCIAYPTCCVDGHWTCGNHKKRTAEKIVCDCPICYEVVRENTCFTTSCSHQFHHKCINKWVNTGHDTCPMCRNELNEFFKPEPTTIRTLYESLHPYVTEEVRESMLDRVRVHEYNRMVRNLHPDLVEIVLMIRNEDGIDRYPSTYERFCDIPFWCPYTMSHDSYLQNIIDSEEYVLT